MDMEQYRRLLITAGLAALLILAFLLASAGAYCLLARKLQIPYGYCLEARFEGFPANDKALKAWIQGQPGILPHSVCVGRFEPDKKTLAVCFTQVQNIALEPPVPD